jgi:tRNA threonylcarbamoyladenosine biosynthesis protein TsaB
MIDALLAECGASLGECDAIAFGAGPGSFTGLRIACGVAQGLAFGARKPVVAVSNLAALAWQAAQNRPDLRRVLAAIDARMNEAYWAIYDIDGESAAEIAAPALAQPATLLAVADEQRVDAMAGDALIAFADSLRAFARVQLPSVRADAAAIARLARQIYAAGGAVAPARAAPLYVRDRVALTVEERNAQRERSAAG